MNRFASLILLVLAGALLGCPSTDPYERLNESDDCFSVVVSPDAVGDDDDSSGDDDDSSGDDDDSALPTDDDDDDDESDVGIIDVHARDGLFDIEVIATAEISPTSGPAGTRFDVVVVLEDTGTDQGNPTDVTHRVTLIVDNGSVTLNEFDLEESPADERRWTIEVEAGGNEETRRTDSLCVALYTEI
ncbi:MAG: hypothetical protein GY898_03350 [Proteobacteria bacterium]|nr:hypothetical protein [Pseudomonadota bacterium]